jgi:SSS family solute:Na+ symporter
LVSHLHLGPLDLAIVALFVLAILALGFSVRLRDSSVLQYLVAGRNLTLPVFVATLVSTWYGGILGMGESVSFFGVGAWVLLGLPYYVFALVYALWLARRVRGAGQISLPERLEAHFGRGVAVIGAVLLFALAVPAAHVLMLGVLASMVTGWSLEWSVALGAVLGAAMLAKGGLMADARLSLLAFAMMYVGFAVMVVYCLVHFPLTQTFERFQGQPLLTWDGGTGWPFVLSFFILGAWTLVDPAFHQRVASAATPDTGRRGVLVCVAFWFLFDLMTITTGLYALALLTAPPENPLMIFPAFGDQVLPAGLKAVFLCGMLGTLISAMVGYTLVAGATFGREIVCRVRRETHGAAVRGWARAGLAVAVVAAAALALQVESVVALWYSWAGALIGALLLPVLLAYGWFGRWRAPAWAAGAAMAAAAAGSVSWMAYGLATGNPFLMVKLLEGYGWVLPSDALPAEMQERLAAAQGFSVGTLLPGLAVSALVLALGAALARRCPIQGRTEQL